MPIGIFRILHHLMSVTLAIVRFQNPTGGIQKGNRHFISPKTNLLWSESFPVIFQKTDPQGLSPKCTGGKYGNFQ